MDEELNWKYWFFYWTLGVSFVLLLTVTARMSLVRYSYYQMRARDNKIYTMLIPASRGTIKDRKDRVVAESLYQYFKMEGGEKLYEGVGKFEGFKFEGKDLAYDLKRYYPYGESMSFVVGWVGEVNSDEIKKDNCGFNLTGGDRVGKTGLEAALDCNLRGKNGQRLVEVDAKGDYVREMGRQNPEEGKGIKLSIDAFWQEKIYKMVSAYDKNVVVVMSEPATGKILALVSSPSFDANKFSYERDEEKIEEYLNDTTDRPLLNRSIGALYHPGSVFKLVVAMAGLEEGVVDKNMEIEDTGVIKVGDYSYSNWAWTKNGTTEGQVNMTKAIKRSNDIYFYRLGEKLGVEKIKKWAEKFGFGAQTGVELTGELAGLVPNDEWKIKVKGERWYLGNTYHLAIGQGDLSVTPLQVNQMTNVIANGGVKCQTSLLADKKVECEDLGISKANVATIVEGMKQACKTGGTAWPLFNFKTVLACKTGTAEVGDGSGETQAWLTAYGPVDNPEVSITVLVERGGEGSDVAAPIVGDILKDWFDEPETLVPRYDKKSFEEKSE